MMGSPCLTLSRITVLLISISGVWSMLTFLGKREEDGVWSRRGYTTI